MDAEALIPDVWTLVFAGAQASTVVDGEAFWFEELEDGCPGHDTFERRKCASFSRSSCILKPRSSNSPVPCVFEAETPSVDLLLSLLSSALG